MTTDLWKAEARRYIRILLYWAKRSPKPGSRFDAIAAAQAFLDAEPAQAVEHIPFPEFIRRAQLDRIRALEAEVATLQSDRATIRREALEEAAQWHGDAVPLLPATSNQTAYGWNAGAPIAEDIRAVIEREKGEG